MRLSASNSRNTNEGLSKWIFEEMIASSTYPYENSLPLQVNVGDSELIGERHCVEEG